MMVGPIMFRPMLNTVDGTSKRDSSSPYTMASAGDAPRPPCSTGHVTAAQPASASARCQTLASSIDAGSSRNPPTTEMAWLALLRGRALAPSHARSSARNAAISGVSRSVTSIVTLPFSVNGR